MHPWHDIPYGDSAPQIVNAIIEIPSGTKAKYEVDKKTGMLRLDRVIHSAVFYPCNYGFIPKSLCGDGDPLDILVISSVSMERLSLVEAKVIGVMRMTDEGEPDDKIIAIPKNDIYVSHIDNIEDLPPHTLPEIKRFFEDYQLLEGEKVTVDGFFNKEKAFEIINDNIIAYQKEFGTN